MKIARVSMGLWILSLLFFQTASGQTITVKVDPPAFTTSISEPGRMSLDRLFKMSDVVALVRIVSGDTENYKTAIYRAMVVTSFKGATAGETIYYGPFIGQRLGEEYFVFLRNAKEPAVPVASPNAAYGTVKYLEDFDEGFAEMEASYECVFDGKDTAQQCDDSVKVCTDYIFLPEGTPVFPGMDEVVPFGCRWVRKSRFLSLLDELANKPGPIPSIPLSQQPIPPRLTER